MTRFYLALFTIAMTAVFVREVWRESRPAGIISLLGLFLLIINLLGGYGK